MDVKKIKSLLVDVFMQGVSYEQYRMMEHDYKLIPGDIIDDYIETNKDLIEKSINHIIKNND